MNRPEIEYGPLLVYDNVGHNQHLKYAQYCEFPGRWRLKLTLILPTWRIWWAPNNASKWQMGFNSAFKGLNSFEVNNYIHLICLTCFENFSNISLLLRVNSKKSTDCVLEQTASSFVVCNFPPLLTNVVCIFRRKSLKETVRTFDHCGRNYACWQSDEPIMLCDNTTVVTKLPRGTINLNLVAHIFETWCIIYASRYSSMILAMTDKTVISLNRLPYSCSTCFTNTLRLISRKVAYECVERNTIV
jgi:hypothetical protein